jgi:hypothetical protein
MRKAILQEYDVPSMVRADMGNPNASTKFSAKPLQDKHLGR